MEFQVDEGSSEREHSLVVIFLSHHIRRMDKELGYLGMYMIYKYLS